MNHADQKRVDLIERGAVAASLICFIHCLALPLAFATMPVLANALPVPEWIHVAILLLAIPMSGTALLAGWSRHSAVLPIIFGACGLALMGLAVLIGEDLSETLMTVAGSTLLVAAHAWNWRLRYALDPR